MSIILLLLNVNVTFSSGILMILFVSGIFFTPGSGEGISLKWVPVILTLVSTITNDFIIKSPIRYSCYKSLHCSKKFIRSQWYWCWQHQNHWERMNFLEQ